MKDKPMMKCGHTANAIDGTGNPVCVICAGIDNGYNQVAENQPDLTGRKAQCSYCKRVAASRLSLPFFEYCPDKEFDNYYDGCFGWD